VVLNKASQSISLYGGKLTSSLLVANHVADLLGHWRAPRLSRPTPSLAVPRMTRHAELQHDFVTAEWARDHEFCITLDDYLRRRTTIAQWTPRMGLGRDGSERNSLMKLAETFAPGSLEAAAMVNAYEQQVRTIYDPLLAV